MKRILAIVVLGFLALGIAGMSAASAAGPAACAPGTGSVLDDIERMATPASYAEKPSAAPRTTYGAGPQLACNSGCANACRQRFGHCPTRQCRQQYYACIRSCGCG
ncbi:MAG: hypothetical protein KIT16_16830 [Rhodospirillaceae bacterium]|nr:hypothetical protein [Rhodospirillaceae bacterium]